MKRIVSLLLSLLMLACIVPFSAAEEVPVITIAVSDATNVEDFNTNKQTLLLEEQCGVDIQFEVYPSVDYNTKINMMIQTGGAELPDVLFVNPNDAELLSWVESGMLLPLTAYYQDEAKSPNLHDAMRRTGVDIAKMMTLYDGNIYALPTFNQTYNSEYAQKTWINTRWLEALDAQAPTTPEELYNLLVKVKNTDLNGNGKADEIGMVGNMNGHMGWFNYIMNAYIFAGDSNGFVVNDGVVDAAYNKDEWKEGLKFMRRLFEEGLLPKEILTQDDNQFLAMLNSETCTAFMFFYASPSRVNAALSWRDDFEAYVPLTNQTTGKPLSTYKPSVPNNGSFFITKNCKNPDAAFRVGDQMVSMQHSIITRWGEEGVDWDYVQNVEGADQWVAWVDGFDLLITVYDDAKFWSSGEIQNRSFIQKGPWIREYGIANGRAKNPDSVSLFDQHVSAADNLYQNNAYRPDEVIPKLIYSAEEIEIVADIRTTLDEFRKEWTANFLSGNLDIDANWDAYVAELDNIGLPQVLEVVQGVYDRMYK